MATTLDDTLNTGVTGFVLADAATAYSGAYTLSGGTNYGVGGINFVGIKQNGADFKDNEDTARDYVYAYTASGEDGGYQVAGETANSAGTSVTYVKGSYLQEVGTDAAGLVLGTTAGTGGILNEATDTIAGGY